MADALSITYDFVLPEVGASDDTWGTKLNADFTQLDLLLTSAFTGGTPTDLGKIKATHMPDIITITSNAPELQFIETDQTMPAGRYRVVGATDTYRIQRNTHATVPFSTTEDIFAARSSIKAIEILNYRLIIGAALATGADANVTAYGIGNHYRFKDANNANGIGAIVRTDTSNFYILLTDTADADGTYNALRPFFINKTTGKVSMHAGVDVTGGLAVTNGVDVTGFLVANNELVLYEGVNFADNVAATPNDLANHIDLYGTNYGFNVTTNFLNYSVPVGAVHNFYIDGTPAARVDANGTAASNSNTIITREKGDFRYVQPDAVGAGLAYNAVGSMAMLKLLSGICAPGNTRAGTNLAYSDAEGTSSSTNPPGTWRCQGEVSGTGNGERTTLWIRVS